MFKFKKGGDSLEDQHEQLLQRAVAAGKSNGQKGLPKQGESLASYIRPIQAGYRNLLATHCKPSATNEPNIAELEKKTFADRQTRSRDRLGQLNAKLLQLNNEKELVPPTDLEVRNEGFIHFLIICIAAFEGFFTRRALSIFEGNSNLTQVIVLLLLIVVFVALPHSLVRLYRSTQTSKYRFVIYAAVAALIIAGFTALAYMRSMFFRACANDHSCNG